MKTLKVTLNDDTVEIYEDVIRAYTGNHLNGEDDLRIKEKAVLTIHYTPPVDMSVLISELKSHVDHTTPDQMPECIQTFIYTHIMPLHDAYNKDNIAQDLLVDIIPPHTTQPLSDRLIVINDRLSNDLDALSLRWHTSTMLSTTQHDNLSKLILLYSDLSIAILDAWKYYDDTLPEHKKYFKES